MPTFEASMKNIEKLAGRKVVEQGFEYAKAEVDSVDGDMLKLKSSDTNRPDLWSEEGVARVLRGIYGVSRGIPKIAVKKSAKKIIVGHAAAAVRPFVAGFSAENINVTDDFLRSMIGVQETLSENYGKKRERIAIGIYSQKKIKFPITYDAVDPESVSFVPLDFSEKLNLKQILEKHPKGIAYAGLLKGAKKYPILRDAKGDVLSFPPVINSNDLGKVEPGEASLFVEVTGPDQKQVVLAANILAQMFSDHKATIESVASVYPYKSPMGREVQCPNTAGQKFVIKAKQVYELLGISLTNEEIKRLLEKMQHDVSLASGKITVTTPCYRGDIMHAVDVIEDIAIAYGYNKIAALGMQSFTAGGISRQVSFTDKLRGIMVGLGFQETISPILTSKDVPKKMNLKSDVLEIENPMTETYSALRSSILPSLLQCLEKNKHVEYPQKIFESGECVIKLLAKDTIKLGACISDSRVSYEDALSAVDALLRSLGIGYKITPTNDTRFIPGRAGSIIALGDMVGVLGEIHPQVLNNWNIEHPVVAFEINVEKLMK